MTVASEIRARDILFTAFRDAGMVPIDDFLLEAPGLNVTLDGYDPERKLGFEYVAVDEELTDITATELKLLKRYSDARILVVAATQESEIIEQAQAFLAN